jgi:hypothetical protein
MDCLVYKAKKVINQPVIAERPDKPVPQLPQSIGFTSVEVVKFIRIEVQQLTTQLITSTKPLNPSNCSQSSLPGIWPHFTSRNGRTKETIPLQKCCSVVYLCFSYIDFHLMEPIFSYASLNLGFVNFSSPQNCLSGADF